MGVGDLRETTLVCVALAVFGAISTGCRRRVTPGQVVRDAATVDGRVRFPVPLRLRGAADAPGMEIDVPVGWLFLPEAPVPSGSAPDVIVGAELPCQYTPVFAMLERTPTGPAVHVRARYAGPGRAGDARATCTTRPVLVDFVSLSVQRLGSVRVSDAAARSAADGPVPIVVLDVVADAPTLPGAPARRARACVPDHDEGCVAGGVCGALAGRSQGVCVPPLDPFLRAGRACPTGAVAVELAHAGAYPARPSPVPGAPVRACLPACGGDGACPSGLECVSVDSRSTRACVPRG